MRHHRSRGLMPFLVASLLLTVAWTVVVACGDTNAKSTEPAPTPTTLPFQYRYMDREVYFPKGVSVSPEMASAHAKIKEYLQNLERQSDLGAGYFQFGEEDDSLLQPPTEKISYQGKNWLSFIRVWDDDLFNKFVTLKLGTPLDQNMIVAVNKNNTAQFYVVLRLSCFTSGDRCQNPDSELTRTIVWRALGYVSGLKIGTDAASSIMSPELSPTQKLPEEQRKFLAEFNSTLELMRKNSIAAANSK